MTDSLSSGLPWVLIVIIGVVILGLAVAYGTSMWRKRRQMRAPGSLERAPGPAPEGAPPAGDDRRAV